MENIEQIKQERDTLQERLNNAAKFFREQKAQIEALTKENEELKNQPKDTGVSTDEWNTAVTELDKLKAAYKELSETSMKKDDQIKTLKQKFEEEGQNAVANKILLENANAMVEAKDKAYKDLEVRFNEVCEKNMIAYNELQKKYNELTQTHDEAEAKLTEAEKQLTEGDAKLTEAEAKLTDAETKIDELQKKCTAAEKQLAEGDAKLTEAEDKINELQKKCTEAENTIISKNQEYKNLQDTYNEVYAKLTDTKTELADAQKTNERNAVAYDELTKVCNELKSKNDELTKVCNELKSKNDELTKVCNELKSENDSLEAYYKELETEHSTLKDEFELMKANKEIEDEVLENVINKIRQIYQITDDILDPKPVTDEK